MNTPQKMLYGVKDAAAALSLSRSSVYNLVRDGVMPAPVKHGTRSLWPAVAVEQTAARIAAGDTPKG